MSNSLNLIRNLIIFGVPVFLFTTLIILINTIPLIERNTLSLAVTVDLLVTIPVVYFLLIRKTEISKTTIVPVMIIGFVIGSYVLPNESQTYLTLFKTWALPVIEIGVLTFVFINFRKAVKAFKAKKEKSPDFFDTLKSSCGEILPKRLIIPFATEIAVFYYGFIRWKTRLPQPNEFTYHKKSDAPSLFGGLLLIIAVETVALHFLFARWSTVAAWIITGLSIYSAVQIFGFAKSLSQRPIAINDHSLILRYGIMTEVQIPFVDIDHIETSSKSLDNYTLSRTLSLLGTLESHNIIIHLKREHKLIGLYGIKKRFKVLAAHIDEPIIFSKKMEDVLQQTS